MRRSIPLVGVTLAGLVLASPGCGKKPDPPVDVEPARAAPSTPSASQEVAEGTVKIEFDTAPDPKAVVSIDGSDHSPKDLEQPIPLKPGPHTVEVKQSGMDIAPQQ